MENVFTKQLRGRTRRRQTGERLFESWNLFQCNSQGDKVARVSTTGTETANGPFEVANIGQLPAKSFERC